MAETIRVVGLKELEKAFQGLRKEVLKELRPELRKAGEIVRAEGASLFSRISPVSAAGYKVRVRRRGVAVEQTLPRVTGLRPDYGALQMRVALVPALESKGDEARDQINSMVDKAINDQGF